MRMMLSNRRLESLHLAVGAVLACGSLASPRALAQSQTYITGFTKNNNIYTNLNQQFPNTGVGVPGSGVGVPNASYLYTPSTSTGALGDAATNGVSFDLTSNSMGQDFINFGGGIAGSADTQNITIGVGGVTTVYLLLGAYNGQSFNITFNGSGGAMQTFNNISIPDFNGGAGSGGINNGCVGGVCEETAFLVQDVGAGGTGNSSNGAYNFYNLTEVAFTLNGSFSTQQLQSAAITSNGYATLLLGVTTLEATPVPLPPASGLLGSALALVFVARRYRPKLAA